MLASAVADPQSFDYGAYAEFRAALLRHIGMEEKILIPAALRTAGTKSVPFAGRIRPDHGAWPGGLLSGSAIDLAEQ